MKKSKSTGSQNLLVYIGDYIDRGNNVKESIQTLINFKPNNFDIVFLLGNHEDMMLNFLEKKNNHHLWLYNGAFETIKSYNVKVDSVEECFDNIKDIRKELNNNIPQDHRNFFDNLKLNYLYDDYYFVHAGINPDKKLKDQDRSEQLWIRCNTNQTNDFEKIVIHGHTPQERITNYSRRINLDTGAFYTSNLSCVALHKEKLKRIFYNTLEK